MTTGVPVIVVFYILIMALTCSLAFHTEKQEPHKSQEAINDARDLFVGNFLILGSRAKRSPGKGRTITASLRSDLLREMCARLRRHGNTRALLTYCSFSVSVYA